MLGHEIVHVTEKHTVRAIQKSKAVQMSNQPGALVKNVARFVDAARTVPRKHAPGEVFQ